MSDLDVPHASVRAPGHLVATADHLATTAGIEMFARGGNAVDAAIAANAAIAVTGPHLCGMGGDLFALVHADGAVHALNASGRAGSGADPEALRSAGLEAMPFRHDVRSVTVPGCVDGWMALHERFGSLELGVLLEPARRLAADGFPASPLLVASLGMLDDRGRAALAALAEQVHRRGDRVERPGLAEALTALAGAGRDSWYLGPFGEGLVELGGGLFTDDDLRRSQADWQPSLSAGAFGLELHTAAPNSQGYLVLAGARLAERLPLPASPHDDLWAHLLIEAASVAGHDRPAVLHEHATGDQLVASIDARLDLVDRQRAGRRPAPGVGGDTTYLCTAGIGGDGRPMGVSLIQSNASGFGSWLVEPHTGVNLHNRGMGFSLVPGHPAELGPRRRPPHTLAPMLATRDGELVAVFGTMGGDAQPQILLQIAARLFHHGQTPARAINAGRWALRGPATGFDTWSGGAPPRVAVEGHAPADWATALAGRGHDTEVALPWDSGFGHAHAIVVGRDGIYVGAADPRARVGSCAGG